MSRSIASFLTFFFFHSVLTDVCVTNQNGNFNMCTHAHVNVYAPTYEDQELTLTVSLSHVSLFTLSFETGSLSEPVIH